MTFPFRLDVNAPRSPLAVAAAGGILHLRGESPLPRRAFVTNVDPTTTAVPTARYTPSALTFSGVPDGLTTAPAAPIAGDQLVTFVAAFGPDRDGDVWRLTRAERWGPESAEGYELSTVPLGAEAWVPLSFNPHNGAPWLVVGYDVSALWCPAVVVGTPSRLLVRNTAVDCTDLAVYLPAELAPRVPLPSTLTATAPPSLGALVRFTGPDGFPLDGDGAAFQVGDVNLSTLAADGRALAVFAGGSVATVLRPT